MVIGDKMKKYIKLNIDDNHLSWGNFSRIIKEHTNNKNNALQTEIFCSIFDIDNINDTTVNNYCVGYRSINTNYKDKFGKYRNKYNRNKTCLINNILNLLTVIDGKSYSFINNNESLFFINDNKNLRCICLKLYDISKNDKDVPRELSSNINSFINNGNLYEAICNILFFVILEKKQPIYEDDLKKKVIENILKNNNLSSNELLEYLDLKFTEEINYNYRLKKLAKNNNAYACFELGMNEYNGYVTGYTRYDKSYEYFYKASILNHPNAYYMLANMYIKGHIGSKSQKELNIGYEYLKKAINFGSIAALNLMGIMYKDGIFPIKKDLNKAIYYFEKSQEKDYPYAYNNLGKIYEERKEYKKAFEKYLESAELGESWACNKIGEYYRTGTFVKLNMETAYKYYNLAIDSEVKNCCFYAYYNLAKYYYKDGCLDIVKIPNLDKTIEYLELASENNIIEASIELLYIYTDIYVKNKYAKAFQKIKELTSIIQSSSLYNNNMRIMIEDNLLKIKNHRSINLDIIK